MDADSRVAEPYAGERRGATLASCAHWQRLSFAVDQLMGPVMPVASAPRSSCQCSPPFLGISNHSAKEVLNRWTSFESLRCIESSRALVVR